MVNINPNRESCMEYMKELIRKGLSRTEIVEECRKKFDNVHPNTFYDWYDMVIVESDIEEWEKQNMIKKNQVVQLLSNYQVWKVYLVQQLRNNTTFIRGFIFVIFFIY